MFISINDGNNTNISAERLDIPVYVRRQQKNDIVLRCRANEAQGIVSKDGTQIYNLVGRIPISPDFLTAEEIGKSDYDRIAYELGISDEPAPENSNMGITLTDIELALCEIYEILGGSTNG